MYPVRTRKPRTEATSLDESLQNFETSPYKPFSHYVCGGYDATGEHTALTQTTTFDDDEIILDDEATSDAMCEPRMSTLDLIERLGIEAAEEAMAEKAKADKKEDDKKE